MGWRRNLVTLTIFHSSSFHMSNHSACSSMFDLKSFAGVTFLDEINSEACEQLNAIVDVSDCDLTLTFKKFLDRFLNHTFST